MDQHIPELRARDPDPKLPQDKLTFLIYGKPTLLVSSLINIYLLGINAGHCGRGRGYSGKKIHKYSDLTDLPY